MDDLKIDIALPESWEQLTQEQLRYIFRLMTLFADREDAWLCVATRFIFKFTPFRVVSPYADGWLVVYSGIDRPLYLDADSVGTAALRMQWLREMPASPVRLDEIGGHKAVSADPTADLSFSQWIACENLYQGYIAVNNPALLAEMGRILYQSQEVDPSPSEEISIFYWWTAVKAMVASMFPNFFHPVAAGSTRSDVAVDIRRSVDAQIRALTKGDITKEDAVLSMPAIRALTELDALAREYEELNKKFPKKHE